MVKHEITLNSSYRENFNNTSENFCKFKILKPIYNVKSIELKSLYIPNSGYIVDVHNNLLPLKITTEQSPPNTNMLIQLKCGDYSQDEILTEICNTFGQTDSWIVGELNNEIFKESTGNSKVYIDQQNTNGWETSYSLTSIVDESTFKHTITLEIENPENNYGTTLSMGYANDLFSQTNPNYPGRLINSLIGLNMFTESHFVSTGSSLNFAVLETNRYNFAVYPSLYMTVGNGRSNYENEYVYDSSSVNPAGSGTSSGGSVGIQNTSSKGFFGRIHMNDPVNSVFMLTNKDLEVKYETRGEYDAFIDELNVSFYSDILNDVLYNFNNIQWEATFIIDGDISRNNQS